MRLEEAEVEDPEPLPRECVEPRPTSKHVLPRVRRGRRLERLEAIESEALEGVSPCRLEVDQGMFFMPETCLVSNWEY